MGTIVNSVQSLYIFVFVGISLPYAAVVNRMNNSIHVKRCWSPQMITNLAHAIYQLEI